MSWRERLREADPGGPIQIADRIWWVGHYLEGDPFQCHAYLIENGSQSVLFDPGSRLTFAHTLGKIERILPFDQIRWFVCHHQDPDITGAMELIQHLIARPDARLVTHWRAEALLKHLALDIPFWRVEANDWRLELEDRTLRFVFTPYMHFPGAFVTFDESTGVLFSSDIFGGLTEGWSLVAEDVSYFEALRPFHEHYMPSREIVTHAIQKLEELPIELIAPQHGSIIPGDLVEPILERVKQLECGLYLLARDDTDLARLMRINRELRAMMQQMVVYRDFSEVASALHRFANSVLPVDAVRLWAAEPDSDDALYLGPENGYRGIRQVPPAQVGVMFDSTAGKNRWVRWSDAGVTTLAFPIDHPSGDRVDGVAAFELAGTVDDAAEDEARQMLEMVAAPLEVALERERIYRTLEVERERIYQQSIRDPLTGLYTRLYMTDQVKRLADLHDRHPEQALGVVMFDLDHFKEINDTHGHPVGDSVLRETARVLLEEARIADLPVRLGGEEFAIFTSGTLIEGLEVLADRVRRRVGGLAFEADGGTFGVTTSAGVAVRRADETIDDVLARADDALYRAKRSGRDRVVVAG